MPLRMAHVVKNQRTLTVPFDEGELNVIYKPNTVTVRLERQWTGIEGAKEAIDAAVDVILTLVDSWDLLGEDDQPVPLTRDALEEVPGVILNRIVQSIMADQRPNPPSGKASQSS